MLGWFKDRVVGCPQLYSFGRGDVVQDFCKGAREGFKTEDPI
jgi:hypothetical protein